MPFNFFSDLIFQVGMVIEYIGVLIVIMSVAVAIYTFFFLPDSKNLLRIKFAKNVIFGLEFIIAADVLLVTVAQTLNEVMQLGGMVLIRILLGYALRQEFAHDMMRGLEKKYKK
ncbi:MAG: DUF1622 domain-containing protein [Candidatus Pacebacteria bacterium]|nr:DUF1622 domain-containing protein [Candidatus Paceibacterota bacterium]